MESSEDDAGIATSAWRRQSARETDVGQTEKVERTSSCEQDTTEARTSCRTPAMSEDNFDGDSVPSPSAQDVNTSTEAILDMIDEIVDGPGAPKRIPLSSSTGNTPPKQSRELCGDNCPPSSHVATTSVASDNSNIVDTTTTLNKESEIQTKCLSVGNESNNVTVSSDNSNQGSVSVTECTETVETLCIEPHCSASNVETGTSNACSNLQSNSALETVQNISESSECEKFERTVKLVTSSETRDCVTVEKAESTSSDCGVSEGQVPFVEKSTKSPLKRRLVRPSPNDRRPDSTVSSSVDSQTIDVYTTVQVSENVTKEVSSSSDTMPDVHDSIKSNEIRNVSDISICKAETSVSSHKKIKLIRPKFVTPESKNNSACDNTLISERQHCQSTSTDMVSAQTKDPNVESTINIISTSDFLSCQVKSTNEIKFSEQNLTEQVTEDINEKEQKLNTNLSLPSTSKSFQTTNNNCKSDLAQESNLSGLKTEATLVSATSDTNQQIPISKQHCTKEEPSLILSKLNDFDIKVNDSTLNVDDTNRTDVLLPDVKIKSDFHLKSDDSSKNVGNTNRNDRFLPDLESKADSKSDDSSINLENTNKSDRLLPDIESMAKKSSTSNRHDRLFPDFKLKANSDLKSEDSISTVDNINERLLPNVEIKADSNLKGDDVTSNVGNRHRNDRLLPDVELKADSNLKSDDFSINVHNKKKTDISLPDVEIRVDSDLKESNSTINIDNANKKDIILLPDVEIKIESDLKGTDSTINIDNPNRSDIILLPDVEIKVDSDLKEKDPIINIDNVNRTDTILLLPDMEIKIDSNLKRVDSILNVENTNKTHKILPDIEQQEEDTCVSSSTLRTYNHMTPNSKIVQNLAKSDKLVKENEKKVPPIKLNLANLLEPSTSGTVTTEEVSKSECDTVKQVPKLTIKLSNIQPEEVKSPIPKLTIKPLRPPTGDERSNRIENNQQISCITKLNIKPILKPPDSINEIPTTFHKDIDNTNDLVEQVPCVIKLNLKSIQKPQDNLSEFSTRCHTEDEGRSMIKEIIPSITKLNIKPILKPPEKINDIHRKSSSSEISESESSENDETTSASDQASVSDQGLTDVVPKVTIKMGKPGTESEGKFYTEQNIPKLTIKGIQSTDNEDTESTSKLKLVITQHDNKQLERIPKLTIKTLAKPEGQPLSPKLTIKPIKPPENVFKEAEVSKKVYTESVCGLSDIKDNIHVPKITIKPVTKSDADSGSKTPKKPSGISDSADCIPIVTKLNIKPIMKPVDNEEISDEIDDKVPVVSKLNIKPIIKPVDIDIDSRLEDVPKIIKLNIKPLKCPEDNSSEQKDCDGMKIDIDKNSIPVITKINIKPIVKPLEEEEDVAKYSENQSSETSSSSDDNGDHIPIVTKLNIKPICKPVDESHRQGLSQGQTIPNITKLNIKPIIKPDDNSSPSSPKKEHSKNIDLKSSSIPVLTKLNIKPIVKPEEAETKRSSDEFEEKPVKNPPLLMKINMKAVGETSNKNNLAQDDHKCNNLDDYTHDNNQTEIEKSTECTAMSNTGNDSVNQEKNTVLDSTIKQYCISEDLEHQSSRESLSVIQHQSVLNIKQPKSANIEIIKVENSILEGNITNNTLPNKPVHDKVKKTDTPQACEVKDEIFLHKKEANIKLQSDLNDIQATNKSKVSLQNCTLLKKLLENTKEHLGKKTDESRINATNFFLNQDIMKPKKDINCATPFDSIELGELTIKKVHPEKPRDNEEIKTSSTDVINDVTKLHTVNNLSGVANDSLTKPLEISISEKLTNQSSGLDSPRIILKINKTDHGSSAKIITEEVKRPDTPQQSNSIKSENIQEHLNVGGSPKKNIINSRRKINSEDSLSMSVGKRLRSSRIIENIEKSPHVKKNMGKRPSTNETSPDQNKDNELSILETKRLKLGQLLSVNKSITITPVVSRITQTSPVKTSIEHKHVVKPVNHSILNNENCSKNGNSKLHNILSNLQAKQKQSLPFQDINHIDVNPVISENRTHSPIGDSANSEMIPKENCHTKVQEMLINENSDFRDLSSTPDDTSRDPLEVETSKEVTILPSDDVETEQMIMTPQPKKRGRPRKIPLTDSSKTVPIILPVTALEERPQRSLRLSRERPTILRKPRGRGRGRGARRAVSPLPKSSAEISRNLIDSDDRQSITAAIDPTCSRIKLPRMTEALDNMPGGCSTPLSSRLRTISSDNESKDEQVIHKLEDVFLKTPQVVLIRGRGGRGSSGGRGRTPRGRARGRGRGGGRGAIYMKETMGIYGRVCGPSTTTVQLFEEETCMMDDNATPAKPSHLMDEDSQSSAKSSTNESNKIKKSKFADLFDSNKIWTAADVKEYTWPIQGGSDSAPQIMMIQEQVAMFLNVKSFKRRYPELKRRPIVGEEKDYVLAEGLVTEALCDLGITAVDASEVLDIMLSDYPHKYEEYRSHQRERQLTEPVQEKKVEMKTEEKPLKVEMKVEKPIDSKSDVLKIDPEKVRQETAAAAIASACEWNARVNASRRTACVDLQSMTVHRRRATQAMTSPPTHLRPPAGFYPHALLPGQYQHAYRVYTPEQLRYFPLNTVLSAPPAPPSPVESSSDSEPEWGSRCSSTDDSDSHIHHAPKRKKLSKVKRSSQTESKDKEEVSMESGNVNIASTSSAGLEDTTRCRTCKLRLEGNRKYTHERFLVCSVCDAKLHPGCTDLGADTVRKCREYAWQCAECKTCCSCQLTADPDKMLFCDLCDRGFHIYCVGLPSVPTGRWHCVECAVCKSCGTRDPAGAAGASGTPSTSGTSVSTEWHHQTRRGPGGHKVYSHSLCTPCARAYRIGRYCPLCERSFIGPKGTMQLVICKLCDRQLHQDCVRQTVSSLKVLDYTCADCRRGGITSRAAAVRLAPRTIATLFMAKRRFNKYAHRQYLQSRMHDSDATDATEPPDPLDGAG